MQPVRKQIDQNRVLEDVYYLLSGKHMPYWLAEDLEEKLKDSPANVQQSRFYADALASAQRYSDPILHRKFQLDLNDGVLSDGSITAFSSSPKSALFDALEMARCIALMAQRYDGLKENIFRIILADHETQRRNPSLSPANKAALDLFVEASGYFLGMGVSKKSAGGFTELDGFLNDQKFFGRHALALSSREADRLSAPRKLWRHNVNPLIARATAKKESHFLFDAFRRLYIEEAPLKQVLRSVNGQQQVQQQPPGPLPHNASLSSRALHKLFGNRVFEENGYFLIEMLDTRDPHENTFSEDNIWLDEDVLLARFTEPLPLLISRRTGVLDEKGSFDGYAKQRLRQLVGKLRHDLDGFKKEAGISETVLARKLARIKLAQHEMTSRDPNEEGLLNSGQLARVIADPMATDIYQATIFECYADATVTLLVDNSGSMAGGLNQMATACADSMAGALERTGTKTEVIGFTTEEVDPRKLSDSFKRRLGEGADWATCGKLILYKDYRYPWRRARQNMGIALAENFFEGTPEGLALQFAWRRILQRPEQKKIIFVIGDGYPNDPELLAQTIDTIEKEGSVYLASIKIGDGENENYSNLTSLQRAEELPAALNRELMTQLSALTPQKQYRFGAKPAAIYG